MVLSVFYLDYTKNLWQRQADPLIYRAKGVRDED